MRKRWRKALPASALALALCLVAPSPAKADLNFGDLMDFLAELMKTLGLGAYIDEINAILAFIGGGNSYLGPGGADFGEMFPDNPNWITPDELAEHTEDRNEDRQARATEAMDTASTIIANMPWNALQLNAWRAANRNPYSIYYALQLGNEGTFGVYEQLNQTNQLLAELGQNDIDQHVKEDHDQVQAMSWADFYYGNSGIWGGNKAWAPDDLDTGM